jgi:uncharacterized protein DUF2867
MRASPAEYLSLKLRAHELLGGIPLYDVAVVDLPGGGTGRTVADIRALDSAVPPSRVAKGFFGLRKVLGRLFAWDRSPMKAEETLLSRVSQADRRDSEVVPGTREGAFLLLYQFPNEALREIRNATVHGWVCVALAPTATGYRLYWAVYVLPVSRLTKPYLIAIEPFRRFILYPAMLRRIRRAWVARYGASA